MMQVSLDNLSAKARQFVENELANGSFDSPEALLESVLTREAERRENSMRNQSETDEATCVRQFLEHLHQTGILREVRSISDTSLFDDFTPIPIDGRPLSQTIIEDRR